MKNIDVMWDDNPIDVTGEANFIWSIANKLRGTYMPDKYGDVVIPMTVLRRFECTLEDTKEAVVKQYEANPAYPVKAMYRISGYQFYNTSHYDLKELCNDSEHIASNLKAYIDGFSPNVRDIFNELEFNAQIDKMAKGGCLYSTVKAFSELDLSPKTVDSIKMGYIFENLIGRFFQNVEAGQFYTGRDIIKTMFSILISEGCDDIFEEGKEITVLDQACGTGGMLSTAYSYLKHYNPNCSVRLFGQEYNPVTHAIGLAEMLIKDQNGNNFRQADTFKEDCFPDVKMRFICENPPFGTPWSGENAKEGQEEAVRAEYRKGLRGRWGAGLPSGSDGQLLFVQSAIAKLADNGRAAIIENGSPLFTGGTASGESQIRRWMLESDLIEAIIALPTDLFYNTGIATYIWVLSKNKRAERKGKIQLIDASNICHKLRKSVGKKRNELTPEDRAEITNLYTNFKETDNCKIMDNTDFIYRDYTVMQPLQRSYGITEDRIESMISKGSLSSLYDETKVYELENPTISDEKGNNKKKTKEQIEKEENKRLEKLAKNKVKLQKYYDNKPVYDEILEILRNNISDRILLNVSDFEAVVEDLLVGTIDKKFIKKIVDGLSKMDKNAEIQKNKKGIIYDTETKDSEIVPWKQSIDDYMKKEVLPHVPDAKWFFEGKDEEASFEQDMGEKTVKIGAEIPFTRYFYKYQQPAPSEELLAKFIELDKEVDQKVKELLNE